MSRFVIVATGMFLRIPRNLFAFGKYRTLPAIAHWSEKYCAQSLRTNFHCESLSTSAIPASDGSSSTGMNPQQIVSKAELNSDHKNGIQNNSSSIVSKADLKKMFQTDPSLPTKSTSEIIRALSIYHICSIPFFVRHSRFMYNLSSTLIGNKFTDAILKGTFFAHFCGGETEDELPAVMKRLQSRGVGAILDYAAESEIEVSKNSFYSCNKTAYHESNASLLISSISSAAKVQSQDHLERFAALKVTALADPSLLLTVSSAINRLNGLFSSMMDSEGTIDFESLSSGLKKVMVSASTDELKVWFSSMDSDADGKVDRIDFMDFLSPSNPSGAKLLVGPLRHCNLGLKEEDLAEFSATSQRVARIADHAGKFRVILMVDAEQYSIQPAIDRLALDAMAKFNKDQPVVFNTYQCYLRDSLNRVHQDLLRSRRSKFVFGAKVVRGAYVEQERALAAVEGRSDPIHVNIEATHRSYHQVLDAILEHKLKTGDKTSMMAATHNQASIIYLLEQLQTHNIPTVGSGVYFAQLLGMRDNLSFALGQKGFSVYKYVPYGPVREVMPYLLRRAEENSDMLSGVGDEVAMLWGELVRRFLPGLHKLVLQKAISA